MFSKRVDRVVARNKSTINSGLLTITALLIDVPHLEASYGSHAEWTFGTRDPQVLTETNLLRKSFQNRSRLAGLGLVAASGAGAGARRPLPNF